MTSLFSEETNFHLPDSDIIYVPNFFSKNEASNYFKVLRKTIHWQHDKIKVFGKTYDQPRLTALYANNTKPYSYSNITMQPNIFTENLVAIKDKVEKKVKVEFTSCLLNLYRNGKDSNGWHADNEKELGINPIIASVTFGQERFFHLKHRTNKDLKLKILLEHGSLLIMKGATQHNWLHQIPKTAKPIQERINLTFRVIQ
ncbi:alpha-ketoglutarate-dependent dioxygenase AlkB [Cellulophaga sp. HaHaR_3_176]|uniref:alpha-ketoglutarate-dependent dioxygenase AlkB family protein n=1 Tax=Cellulophaga sp. HaHaR_3_176 TaxID=1942464 RepID=UPI001C1F3DCC|nr:alpha-ketoglutarate-dependent dioxygenase AlkB [Cellulophaga sp. HaHaR_3_176]QWX84448.1 alpha-ketoglutarate-dependent dioxygenase AlkB [Cellulophaga sp. HaHaR_3_176]